MAARALGNGQAPAHRVPPAPSRAHRAAAGNPGPEIPSPALARMALVARAHEDGMFSARRLPALAGRWAVAILTVSACALFWTAVLRGLLA